MSGGRGGSKHKSLELKSSQAGAVFIHAPPRSFFLTSVPSVQTLGVIGTAITGEFPWHQIRLFVNAEHSQRFIFIRWISSVTYSENSDSERTPLWHSGRGGASKHPNNYTGSRVTSGWLSFLRRAALCSVRIKTTVPQGETHIRRVFISPFICQWKLFCQMTFILFYLVYSPPRLFFYLHYWEMYCGALSCLWLYVESAVFGLYCR